MSEPLHLSLGTTRELRAPREGVAHWSSSAPAVVSTTDEDLVNGRPGGLLTAHKLGRATVTARNFDNQVLGVWEVIVEASAPGQSGGATQSTATVRVEKGAVVDLPTGAGPGWTIANPRIATLTPDGQVRGLSPGITTARGGGPEGSANECTIEVSGTLDAGLGQAVNLADFFSCPVRAWRSGAPNEVPVDSAGVVNTGERPRTVEISAELASGRAFSFRLRIGAGARTGSPVQPGTLHREAAVSPSGAASGLAQGTPAMPARGAAAGTPSPPSTQQRQEVENHLRAAEAALGVDDWTRVGAELTAAVFAAATEPDLRLRVDEVAARLRTSVNERAANSLVQSVQLLSEGSYESVALQLDTVRFPREHAEAVEALKRVAVLSQEVQAGAEEPTRVELDRQLGILWNELAIRNAYAALPALAEVGLQYGERVLPLLVDVLGNPALAGMPPAIREALGKSLAGAGASALDIVLSRLIASGSSPAANLLLSLLADFNLQKHALAVMKLYARSGPAEQAELVDHIAAMLSNMPKALFDLLAGVLNRMPPDLRLAKAVQARIKARCAGREDELEAKACNWGVNGNRNAQTILVRLYDYDAKAFGHG